MHTEKYTNYLRSISWHQKRSEAIAKAEHKCQKCGNNAPPLHVHHLNYDRLGNERMSDLVVLCPVCHVEADEKRKRDTENERYYKAVDTYMTKKYGEFWEDRFDFDYAQEEFDRWAEERGY